MSDNFVIGVTDSKEVSTFETVNAIKKAGFKNVFIQWYNKNSNPSQKTVLKYIKSIGLNITHAHLEYHNINDIWQDFKGADDLVLLYKRDIKIMKDNNIPMVFMHLSTKNASVKYNELGLKRLKEIIDYAESLNIKIAFENTELKGYLEYLFDNINSSNIGVCFDSGHYHAFFKDDFNFEKFKNKIIALHLHDNDKKEDLHLLPFDGNINWNNIIYNLKKSGYKGKIILEVKYNTNHSLDINKFYKEAYERAKILYKMMHEKKFYDFKS